MLLRDWHREAGVLRFLDRHLTIAVVSTRETSSSQQYRESTSLSFLVLSPSSSSDRVAAFVSSDCRSWTGRRQCSHGPCSILIRGWDHRRRIRIGDLRLEVRRATCLTDDVLHVRLITMAVQGTVLRSDVVGVRDATERVGDDMSFIEVRTFDARYLASFGVVASVTRDSSVASSWRTIFFAMTRTSWPCSFVNAQYFRSPNPMSTTTFVWRLPDRSPPSIVSSYPVKETCGSSFWFPSMNSYLCWLVCTGISLFFWMLIGVLRRIGLLCSRVVLLRYLLRLIGWRWGRLRICTSCHQ